MTKREIIMAKREGYAGCLIDELGWSYADAFDEATERYPTPKKKVPKVECSPDGTEYKVCDGGVWFKSRGGCTWSRSKWSLAEFAIIANLIMNPTIEVDDD